MPSCLCAIVSTNVSVGMCAYKYHICSHVPCTCLCSGVCISCVHVCPIHALCKHAYVHTSLCTRVSCVSVHLSVHHHVCACAVMYFLHVCFVYIPLCLHKFLCVHGCAIVSVSLYVYVSVYMSVSVTSSSPSSEPYHLALCGDLGTQCKGQAGFLTRLINTRGWPRAPPPPSQDTTRLPTSLTGCSAMRSMAKFSFTCSGKEEGEGVTKGATGIISPVPPMPHQSHSIYATLRQSLTCYIHAVSPTHASPVSSALNKSMQSIHMIHPCIQLILHMLYPCSHTHATTVSSAPNTSNAVNPTQ